MRHSVLILFRFAVLCFALAAAPAALAQQTRLAQHSLDSLFALLKSAPDSNAAIPIANEIWRRWTEPDDPALASRIAEILLKRREYDLGAATDLASALIKDHPEYAEGWNQRATLEYLVGDYPSALNDIAETLKREPRHFGALAGEALVYIQLGQTDKARDAMRAALKIHPFLTQRALFPELGPPPVQT